jgi:glycosyltransferase involved in cell wall biosynthesis
MPRVPLEPLYEKAASTGATVRFVPRFVPDAQMPAFFRRADLVVLPYREIDQSAVLYTALAFAKPLVLTSVGGFPEVADHGAARLVPPGDAAALAQAIADLLADDAARERLSAAAEQAAAGPYSWDAVAAQTMALYRELLA